MMYVIYPFLVVLQKSSMIQQFPTVNYDCLFATLLLPGDTKVNKQARRTEMVNTTGINHLLCLHLPSCQVKK